MTEKILINTGRSRRGPSRYAPFLRCLQEGAHSEILHTETISTTESRDPLVMGSAGHVGEAHFMRRAMAQQQGEPVGRWYTPREAIARYCAETIEDEARRASIEAVMQRTQMLLRQRDPGPPGRIVSVENEVFGVVGQRFDDRTGETAHGLWAVEEATIDTLLAGHDGAVRSFTDDAWVMPRLVARRPVWVSKRLDLAYERRDGLIVDVDYKFLSHVTKSAYRSYLLDLQFAVVRILGQQIHGAHYGGVEAWLIEKAIKPATTQIKVEKARLPATGIDAHVPQLLVWVEEQIEAHKDGDSLGWPRAASETVCRRRYGYCDYFDVCHHGAAGALGGALVT